MNNMILKGEDSFLFLWWKGGESNGNRKQGHLPLSPGLALQDTTAIVEDCWVESSGFVRGESVCVEWELKGMF
jgi:hypothetical protein